MRTYPYWLLIVVGCGVAACAGTSNQPHATNSASAPMNATTASTVATAGYINTDTLDLLRLLPAAPIAGDARDEADRRIFRETRIYKDSPRWDMSIADAEADPAAMLEHFACSLEIALTPQQAPRMIQLLSKATRAASVYAGRGKDFYKRKRPFLIDEGPICRPFEEVARSFDYPSGHATVGWSWAMVLAQVSPEQAVPILARGRAIGDSRVFCGVHNASSVENARVLVSATMAVVMATPTYQDDLQQARQELIALQSQPHKKPDSSSCQKEAELVAMPIIQQQAH